MGLYRAKLNPSVRVDIRKARQWYAAISLELSIALNAEISLFIDAVTQGPFHFGIRFQNVRRVNLNRFPYAFHFVVDEENMTVTFLNFFHIKRDTSYAKADAPDNFLNEP